MSDLTTSYLGLELKHPIVNGASPLTKSVDNVKKLEDSGVSAIVMHSVFEEQLKKENELMDEFLFYGDVNNPEASNYFPNYDEYDLGPEEYLDQIRKIKSSVDVPVFASLNGYSSGGWVDYAKQIEGAGADALELNIYYLATNPDQDAATVEKQYLDVVKAIRNSVTIPIAVKLSPFFSAPANMIKKMSNAGANAFILFNRFYQPEINVNDITVETKLHLSTSLEKNLAMRWIALLYGRVQTDFAASTGIHSVEDVAQMLLAGASITQVVSVLLKTDLSWVNKTVQGLQNWMDEHEFLSIKELQGSISQQKCSEPAAFERANYMKTLMSYTS